VQNGVGISAAGYRAAFAAFGDETVGPHRIGMVTTALPFNGDTFKS
jgi:hypothetical protein